MSLPRTGLGTTSLGAVGGARGTAAGAIRILVEFLTQYDSAAVKQLESDLASLESAETAALQRSVQASRALETSEKRRLDIQKQLQKFIALGTGATDKPGAIRRELREIERVGVLSKEGQRRLKDLDETNKFEGQLLRLKTREARLNAAILSNQTKLKNTEHARTIEAEQRLAVEQQLGGLQQLRAQVPSRLAGLALGAVGGIFGGAVVGVGFAAADALLKGIEDSLLNIIDPARKVREEMEGIGEAIRSASSETGDFEAGAREFLAAAGIQADGHTVRLLAELAAMKEANEAFKLRNDLFQINDTLEKEKAHIIEVQAEAMARQAFALGKINEEQLRLALSDYDNPQRRQFLADAEKLYAEAAFTSAAATARAAAESAKLEQARRQQAAAAQLAAFAEQQMTAAISRASGLRSAGFDAAIEGAQSAGPSKRTRALEAQIERLQNAPSGDAGRARRTELANIAEERALILLRQRLRLLGTNIDLEKFSGKFLLEAINAKQAALQKEADAQDRLNRLLDLQFKMSQRIQRDEGESISDFLERRAQENRGFLEEQRDLEREKTEERLQELEDKTQDEVALQELAERKKNAAVKQGTDNRIKNLQKELEASRKADAAAVEAKVKALQKQKAAYEQSAKDAEHFATIGANAQIREAIRGVQKVTELAGLSGQISGLTAAKNFLSSLLGSGVLTPGEATDIRGALERINTTLEQYVKKSLSFRPPGRTIYREGGLIPLNNASTPFGSNVRFGEEGTEYGLIFQQKVAKNMKSMMKSTGNMTFNLQKGDDWMRDRYEMRRLVKEAVSEALK